MPALAHTATSSGPNTEVLLLGGGMIVLALVFFFQKSASRRVSLVLAVLGAVAITGAFTLTGGSSGEDHHGASISIVSPSDGDTVEAGPATVEIELTGASIEGEGAGHVHVYVDGEDEVMASSLDVDIEVPEGEHEISAEYVDAEHRPLDPPVTDSVTIVAE